MFSFTLKHQKNQARAGEIHTPHGVIQTPVFMPVGTQATVKALSPDDLERTGTQVVLANTYHLYLRPGEKTVAKLGGIQKFMGWNKPVLTDSGGFQVFSLGKQMEEKAEGGKVTHAEVRRGILAREPVKVFSKITDDGVEFSSHLDGSKHMFTPEKAIEIQRQIGADIIMAFDECTPDDADIAYTREALDRTHRWAKQCKEYWEKRRRKSAQGNYQALFGIIQGAMHRDLRIESANFITHLGFDGIAVGGETIGYNMKGTIEVMNWIRDILPADKPRYAMGLGRDPQDIVAAVRAGFDMFDCVAPTRLARNGALYVGRLTGGSDNSSEKWKIVSPFPKARLQIGSARWMRDPSPIQKGCDCWTCSQGFSRAYLHHLYKAKELLYYRLASIHNVRFMVRLTNEIGTMVD